MIQTTRIIAVSALLLWSMTAAAQELVHFPSFEDNGPGRPSTVLDGYLSRPTGEGQHPAVIFLHECGGLLMGWKIEPGESDWASELTRRGYAVGSRTFSHRWTRCSTLVRVLADFSPPRSRSAHIDDK